MRRLHANELLDGFGELIFLNRLGEESDRAFLNGAIAMLGARARRDNHDRDAARRGALAQLNHELVTGHARHFEVGDDQMAAVLRDQLLAELVTLGSSDEAAEWAHKRIAAKNTLTASDAALIEEVLVVA